MSRDSRVSFSVKAMMTALMLFGWASACYGQEDLPTHLSQLRSAQPSQYDSIIESALKNNPTAEALIKAIRDGVSAQPDESRKEKLVAGWSAWEATDSKGVTRPYQIFMPKNVSEGAKPAALIVHMHGAVGRPEFYGPKLPKQKTLWLFVQLDARIACGGLTMACYTLTL